MKIVQKCVLIGTGSCFCLLAAVLAAGVFYANTRHAAIVLQGLVNKSIPGKVSWEKSVFSPIAGTLEIRQALVHSAQGKRIVSVSRIFLNLSLTDLLKRRIVISDLVIERPDIDLWLEQDGALNLVRAFAGGAEAEETGEAPIDFPLVVNALRWSDGLLRYTTGSGAWQFGIGKSDVFARGDLSSRTATVSLLLSDGYIQGPDRVTRIDFLNLSAAYQDETVEKIVLEAGSDSARLRAAGKILHVLKNPVFDMEVGLESPLAHFMAQFNIDRGFSGDAAARLNLLGPPGNPEATLDIVCGKGRLFDQPIADAHLHFVLNDRLVAVKQADIHAFSGLFTVNGQIDFKSVFARGFLSAPVAIDQMGYALTLLHEGVDLDELIKDRADIKGKSNGKVFLSGKGVSFPVLSANVELNIQGKGITTGPYQNPADWEVRGKAQMADKKIRVHSLSAVSGDLELQSAGALDFTNEQLNARLWLHLPDVRTVLAPLGIEDSRGNLTVKLNASGTIRRPFFDLALEGGGLAGFGFFWGDLKADAALKPDGRLDVLKIDLNNKGAVIKASGSVKLFEKGFHPDRTMPLDLDMTVHGVDPGLFIQSPFSGTINGRATAGGPLRDLTVSLELNGKKLAYNEIRIGDADAAIRLDRGRVTIDRATLVNRKSAMDITGDVDLFEKRGGMLKDDPVVTLELKSARFFPEDFWGRAKGKFAFDAHVRGSVKNPEGEIHLTGTDILIQDLRVKQMEIACSMADQKLTVEKLDIFPDAGSFISGTGWISLEKQFRFTLASRGIMLSRLPWIQKMHPVEGEISFTIAGAGSFQNPEISGQVGLTHLRANGTSLSDFNLALDVRDQVVRINADPGFGIAGSYHLTEKTFVASARFQDADLSPVFLLFDQPLASGNINGMIRVNGKAGAPYSYAGSIDIDRLHLRFKDETIVHSGMIHVLFTQQNMSIAGFHLNLADGKILEVSGKADRDGPVSVIAKGDIPLSAIRLFSTDVDDASGRASFEVRIRGKYADPEIEGEIRLMDIAATVPFLSQTLHHVNGRVRISPEKIFFDSIAGQLDDGRFTVEGEMAMDRLAPSDLALDITLVSLPVNIPETMDMVVDAALLMRGGPEKSRIDGNITLQEGTYFKDVNLNLLDGAVYRKRKTGLTRADISTPFLKNMALNVSLKHRSLFIVDNNLARMEISPDLKLIGTVNHPVINGRARIESGTVVYRGKTFTLNKGNIDFINPYAITPTIDVQGDCQVRDWLVSLEISGTPEELAFVLSSDPMLTDGDILSLLLTGRTSSEMIQSEGGSTQSATQMLARILASKMDDDIKRTTGLDIFEAEVSDASDAESAGEVKVTLGKELSRRMTVKYSMETEKGEMVQNALAEYKFFENMLISGFQNNRGGFGGSIKYRLEFR